MVSQWLGIPAAFIAWGFALYVFIVAPSTRGSRFLIAMLVIDGLAVFTSGDNHLFINPVLESLGLPTLQRWMHQSSDWAIVAVYLPFLGITLKTPLVAPLKHVAVRRLILFGGLGIALAMPFLPEPTARQFAVPFYAVICISLAWGFAAAVHAWYIAPTEADRARARAFTFAFGIRDLLWTFTFGVLVAYYYGWAGNGFEQLDDPHDPLSITISLLYQVAVILYVPLVAYGMLRVQLFDIDLRIKRTLKRSTIAAAFVATFFVISELAGNYLSDQLGAVMGVLCTGALVFFLNPIERAAERLTDAAMPNTVDTPEYELFRKLQVYDSALRASLENGRISTRERKILDSLIDSMAIDRQLAQRMEQDALAAAAV